MQTFEITLQFRMVRLGDTDPLIKPQHLVNYMLGAFTADAGHESLWLISMNPKLRPIARTLLRMGPCAAAMTSTRDLFRVALHADANAIAVVRGERSHSVQPTPTDHRKVKEYAAAAECLNITFHDYLVLSTVGDLPKPLFNSWRHSAG